MWLPHSSTSVHHGGSESRTPRGPEIVTGGLYRFCRNPIFLALLVVIAGYTLMLPTVLSLVLLAGAYLGIRLEIAAEERYLEPAYGNSFRDYAGRVGRLLPVSASCAAEGDTA